MGAIQQGVQAGGRPPGPGNGPGNGPGHPPNWYNNGWDDDDYYTPQYYTQPNVQTQQTVQPTPNALPTAPSELVVEPLVTVEPDKNVVFKFKSLSLAQIQAIKTQIDQQNEKLLDQLSGYLPDQPAIIDEIQKLPSGISPDKQKEMLEMVRNGDVGQLLIALNAGRTSPAGIKLLQQATAYAKFNALKTKIANGTLTPSDLASMRKALAPFLSAGSAVSNVEKYLFGLAINGMLKNLLIAAIPGFNTIPVGNNITIVWVNTLPPGTLIALGNGTVLIGTGPNASSITIGTGSVAQAMGMQIAAGDPVPESQSDLVTGGTVLKNAGGSDVNYVLNDTQKFTMKPKYSQALPKDVVWVAAFDRGGDNGQARYQLEEGTYNFTPTTKGWELYLQSAFSVTVDNSLNATEFHYVLNNTAYKVAARGKREHSEKYLPLVRFDNGNGTVKQKSLKTGTYCVSIAPDNTLDLYTTDSLSASAPAPTESATSSVKTADADENTSINLFDNAAAPAAKSGSFGNLSSVEEFFAQPGMRESPGSKDGTSKPEASTKSPQ